MKIYYHPASTTSRPLMLFAAEQGLDIDFQVVDLFTGEHMQRPYEQINPNRLVPVLQDGDFRLTESSAIRSGLSAYPNVKRWLGNMKALKNWKKVNEVFDGFAASMKDVPFETV